MPAYGVFARHVTGLELHDVKLTFGGSEARPAVIARDIDGLILEGFGAQKGNGPSLEVDGVKSLPIKSSAPLADTMMPAVGKMTF